jgi:ATP adenylyltransferase
MDYLWTPWRYRYIASGVKDDRCVFCAAAEAQDDSQSLIVLRARKNFVILNRYPYTSGHVMVVPYAHQATLAATEPETLTEMMALAQQVEQALETLYHPDGYNLGMNLGRAAGAGIAGHLHLHVLPRWIGDTNFMTTVGETRVQPEELTTSYQRLRGALSARA